jgi:hypothetical protein
MPLFMRGFVIDSQVGRTESFVKQKRFDNPPEQSDKRADYTIVFRPREPSFVA